MKGTDNFAGWFAEALKERLSGLVFVPPRELKVGDVVTVTHFVQFHNDDKDVGEWDATNGQIRLNWTFYSEGTLFLVLGRDEQRIDVMTLDSGHTGWLYRDDVKLFE